MEQTSAGALEFSIQREKCPGAEVLYLPPQWLSGKIICLQFRSCRFHPWVRKVPWRRAWQATPVFLPGESHGQRSLVGYSPQGHKDDSFRDDWSSLACTHAEFLYMYWDMSPGASYIFCIFIQNKNTGDQWLRLRTSNTGCLGSTPGQETTCHLPQRRPGVLKCINNFFFKWMKEWMNKIILHNWAVVIPGKIQVQRNKEQDVPFFHPK